MLYDEGAWPHSLVAGRVISFSAKTLIRGNPRKDLHTDYFPGLTIHVLKLLQLKTEISVILFNNVAHSLLGQEM